MEWKYRKKNPEINLDDVFVFLRGGRWPAWFYTALNKGKIKMEYGLGLSVACTLADNNTLVQEGDMIVRDTSGRIYSYNYDEFHELYEMFAAENEPTVESLTEENSRLSFSLCSIGYELDIMPLGAYQALIRIKDVVKTALGGKSE